MKRLIVGVVIGLLVGVVIPAQAITVMPTKPALDYLQYMCDASGAMTVFLMDNAKDPLPIDFQYLGVQKACANGGYDPNNLTAAPAPITTKAR